MILFPIATISFLTWYVVSQFKTTGEPTSYDNWLKEPNDLEIVE